MKVNCKNEGQLQSFKREQFAVRNVRRYVRRVYYVVRRAVHRRGSARGRFGDSDSAVRHAL